MAMGTVWGCWAGLEALLGKSVNAAGAAAGLRFYLARSYALPMSMCMSAARDISASINTVAVVHSKAESRLAFGFWVPFVEGTRC